MVKFCWFHGVFVGQVFSVVSCKMSKVADQIKMSFENAKDQEGDHEGSFHDEDYKLNFAGYVNPNAKLESEMQKTSTPASGKEQNPLNFPNVKTTLPKMQFPPPPVIPSDMRKGESVGGAKFKTFNDFPPQRDYSAYKASPEGNVTQYYEVTHAQIPRIPQFSGDEPPQKGDVTYREWKYEVQCLINDPEIKETTIIQSIRRSLRGTAKTMLIPLGEKATVIEILDKLNILFGEVSNNGMIMQEFFNTFQFEGECATSFGCRLESMLQNAIDNGYLSKSSKNDLLRHKFWTSLSSERLKSQTRHKYDTLKNYDHLLLEIRKVEKEMAINKTPAEKVSTDFKNSRLHQHGIAVEDEVEEKINKRIENLQTELEGKIDDKFNQILQKLDASKTDTRQSYSRGSSNRGNGNSGRGEYARRNFQNNNSYRGNQYRRPFNPRGRGMNRSSVQNQDPNY